MDSHKKEALRRVLLKKRDAVSYDMADIASSKIVRKLEKIPEFAGANVIASYYPTGSEVLTQNMMLGALGRGKKICLPKVKGDDLVFKQIEDLKSLERGAFGIMEPASRCETVSDFDIVIVPAVGASLDGSRLGYGHGYYDRFLAKSGAQSVALCYSKQIVKSVPTGKGDVPVNWIVTEDAIHKVRKGGES